MRTLSGCDRARFRDIPRLIGDYEAMRRYLRAHPVCLRDFGSDVDRVSRRLEEASLAEADALRRPVKCVTWGQVRKEEWPVASRPSKGFARSWCAC
jgi:hypothetical protein